MSYKPEIFQDQMTPFHFYLFLVWNTLRNGFLSLYIKLKLGHKQDNVLMQFEQWSVSINYSLKSLAVFLSC